MIRCKENTCIVNEFIDCTSKNKEDCRNCGWNPLVNEARIIQIKSELYKKEEEQKENSVEDENV